MSKLPKFPVDPQSLDLLYTAVRPGPDAERSSLGDLCTLMARLSGYTDLEPSTTRTT
jgi:hypothetical protein